MRAFVGRKFDEEGYEPTKRMVSAVKAVAVGQTEKTLVVSHSFVVSSVSCRDQRRGYGVWGVRVDS